LRRIAVLVGASASCAIVVGCGGTSLTATGPAAAAADVVLSNGAHLQLRSAQGRWLVERIVPGHSRHKPSGGRCSSSITVPA